MDLKSVIVLVVSFVLLILWYPLVTRYYSPAPATGTNTVETATNQTGGNSNIPVPPVLSAATPNASLVRPEAPEEVVIVEDENTRDTLTSHGGGLKLVELKKYPESVGCRDKKKTGAVATLNTKAPTPAFVLLGPEALQGDGVYALTRTPNGVRAEKLLPSGIRVVKEFQFGTNYLISVSIRFANETNRSVRLPAQEFVIGTATPTSWTDDPTQITVEWFNGAKAESVGQSWFDNRSMGCSALGANPRYTYLANTTNVYWAAVQNRFFTQIAITPTNAPAPQLVVRRVDLPRPTAEELAEHPKAITNQVGFQTAFVYPETELAAKGALERRFDVFAGPKEFKTLARLASKFQNNVDVVMGFGPPFGFFAKLLLLTMNGLYALGLSYGLTIIAITVVIKVLFWPLTQASTRSMKRMAALQPQMKAIQEKYKDDPKKMNQKVMEFMKENKVNPAAGCLPILIQLPFFFGFLTMLRSAIELRGAQFLWACDLSQPDTVWVIPGLNFPLNPLPLIMGGTQFWQMRLTPPSPGMDPVQQKIMQYMPLMFLFFLYNFSSGLTLYWTVQNLLTIAQMKLTKASDAKTARRPGPSSGAEAPRT